MKWLSLHWKQIRFAWLAYRLRRQYQAKLTEVHHARWERNRRGLMTQDRRKVHEWYGQEFDKLYKKFFNQE
jgi:hypothetical protein